MLNFKDYSSFTQYIDLDCGKADLNPVRFINVETMKMWAQVKSYLTSKSQVLIKLSDFCENEDIAPNMNQLKKKIRMVKDKTLVVPLSEYLRINRPLATKTLYDILHANFENNTNGDLRIYIILYRMSEVLSTLQLGPREMNAVLIISEGCESDYSLMIVQNNLNFSLNGNVIEGFKKYMIYWEENPDKPIVLRTSKAINYTDITFSDNVEVIVSAFDFLKHLGVTKSLRKEYGTDAQWEMLAAQFRDNKDFDRAICEILLVTSYNDNLFSNWAHFDSMKKWILWVWAMVNGENEYLVYVLNNCKTVDDFEEKMYSCIAFFLNSYSFWDVYNQRKDILVKMKIIVSKNLLFFLENLSVEDKLKCLTDVSIEEREKTFECLANMNEFDIIEDIIKNTYPCVFEYLQPLGLEDNLLESYFYSYRICKLKNKATEDFLNRVNEVAKEHGKLIWQLKSRNALVEKMYDDKTIIQFVDAFGAEYVSIFKKCFDQSIYDFKVEFGYCNMPSITSENNDFYKNRNHMEPYYELDILKHSNSIFPSNIEREFEIVKKIKGLVDKSFSDGYKTIIIAADHGSSRLAVIARGDSHESFETSVKYKYGRYCIDNAADYSDIKGCFSHDEFWIFANYDRFIQKGAPICEIHGGASLEEMIVPVITIQMKDALSEVSLNNSAIITVISQLIKIPISRDIEVQFSVDMSLNKIGVIVDNQKFDCEYNNGIYSFIQHLESKKTDYVAKVVSDGHIIGVFKYRVVRPMEKRQEFDI
ncbi:MAG: BREX-4 system phosphatase PglZ [Peptostreptococcaceae bacterium]|nr:BREX-4 system phosphatase PglZ [Peptostreptococcaceae bacterium]